MWSHFPFNIYVEYESKNFERYFNVFSWKKQPFGKKKRKCNNSNNQRMSKVLKIDFVLSDDEIQSICTDWDTEIGNITQQHDDPAVLSLLNHFYFESFSSQII